MILDLFRMFKFYNDVSEYYHIHSLCLLKVVVLDYNNIYSRHNLLKAIMLFSNTYIYSIFLVFKKVSESLT